MFEHFEQFERWELDAFAEGVDMPHVAQVVDQHLQEWQDWLKVQQEADRPFTQLARFDCPIPIQLRDYYWNELPAANRQKIDAHLQLCASCSGELQSMTAFVDEEETSEQPAPSWSSATLNLGQNIAQGIAQGITQNIGQLVEELGERVRTVVANLIPPLLPALAPVALRGDESLPTFNTDTPTTLLFSAEEFDISLVAMKETNGELFLSGQVFGPEPISAGKVTLTPADQHLIATELTLDQSGAFVLSSIRPGYYQLVLTVLARSIVIPNVLLQS